MTFDYFYGQQAEQFSFYRVPKVLFTDKAFSEISSDAKLLYGIFLDRMNLSAKNGWIDGADRVYIVFTIEEIRAALLCSDKKALKLLDELERKSGLIERKRQGLGKPNLIYVKNFILTSPDGIVLNRKKDDSGISQKTTPEPSEIRCSNTDINNNNLNDTDSFQFTSFSGENRRDAKRSDILERETYREIIRDNVGYDALVHDYPHSRDVIDEIFELIVDVVCSTASHIRISGDNKPAEVVRAQFLKLDHEHLQHVLDGMRENTTHIKNIRQYVLAALYNSTLTINTYYDALVRHDMAEGYP